MYITTFYMSHNTYVIGSQWLGKSKVTTLSFGVIYQWNTSTVDMFWTNIFEIKGKNNCFFNTRNSYIN